MAKLHFKYGAMNSGKTTVLLQTAHNYEERDQKVILIKPSIDSKGEKKVVSRIGAVREVDELIEPDDKIIEKLKKYLEEINCILVDEAQFLKKEQVDELFIIAKTLNIPVIAFGLRTDFRSYGFEGSIRLLELADELEEMPTICRCGKKARFNARKINENFVTEGETIVIDDGTKATYESVCGNCYIEKVLKLKR